jgi:hypothetical protein
MSANHSAPAQALLNTAKALMDAAAALPSEKPTKNKIKREQRKNNIRAIKASEPQQPAHLVKAMRQNTKNQTTKKKNRKRNVERTAQDDNANAYVPSKSNDKHDAAAKDENPRKRRRPRGGQLVREKAEKRRKFHEDLAMKDLNKASNERASESPSDDEDEGNGFSDGESKQARHSAASTNGEVHPQPGGDSHAKHHNHEHGLGSKHEHTSHSADERAADVARQRDQSHHEGQCTHSTFYMLPGYDHVVLPLRPGTKITLEWEVETKKTYEATVDTVKKAEGRVRVPPRMSLRRLQTSGPIIEVSQAFFDL